ncbi:CEP95 [Acanthosepion pharaonis]|uniref:CEP95 n=1 Tax=Acanthosepion pharaonis TaxID=158019 RepID=A0A812CNM6_ACAPH|nr:CEP95 [Sepia pharaonis]
MKPTNALVASPFSARGSSPLLLRWVRFPYPWAQGDLDISNLSMQVGQRPFCLTRLVAFVLCYVGGVNCVNAVVKLRKNQVSRFCQIIQRRGSRHWGDNLSDRFGQTLQPYSFAPYRDYKMLRTLSTVDQGLVEVANSLLVQLHVPIYVESLEDINTNVFVTLFEGLYGEPLPELLPNPQTKQDEIHNCQIVIDTLANKILHTSLSHITGKDIIEGDRTSVANLLEILTGLLEFLTEKIECENSQDEEQEEEVFHDQAFLGNQDDIDQLMEGIKNLPSFQNAANCETSNENGSVKAAWQDFKNSENSKTLAPEHDLLVGPVKADNDFHNLTFSILSSSIELPSSLPVTSPEPPPPVILPEPLPQEDKDTNINSSLLQMDLSELRPRPVTISLDEITAKNDNHKMQKNEKETVPSQSSKGQNQSKENISIKLPKHEEEKTPDSPSSEAKEFSPEEVTELLKTYSNKRTTDELLDMIDVTLRQLEAETKPSTSSQRVSQKKQVHFEEPSCIKKVRKIKVPVSMWHHKQGDWKKNKKLKFVRRNYAEDLAELHKDIKLKAKAEKTAANEKEKEFLKTTGEYIKFTNTAKKKKPRKPNMNARVYTTTKGK